jgi:hypothetical protein
LKKLEHVKKQKEEEEKKTKIKGELEKVDEKHRNVFNLKPSPTKIPRTPSKSQIIAHSATEKKKIITPAHKAVDRSITSPRTHPVKKASVVPVKTPIAKKKKNTNDKVPSIVEPAAAPGELENDNLDTILISNNEEQIRSEEIHSTEKLPEPKQPDSNDGFNLDDILDFELGINDDFPNESLTEETESLNDHKEAETDPFGITLENESVERELTYNSVEHLEKELKGLDEATSNEDHVFTDHEEQQNQQHIQEEAVEDLKQEKEQQEQRILQEETKKEQEVREQEEKELHFKQEIQHQEEEQQISQEAQEILENTNTEELEKQADKKEQERQKKEEAARLKKEKEEEARLLKEEQAKKKKEEAELKKREKEEEKRRKLEDAERIKKEKEEQKKREKDLKEEEKRMKENQAKTPLEEQSVSPISVEITERSSEECKQFLASGAYMEKYKDKKSKKKQYFWMDEYNNFCWSDGDTKRSGKAVSKVVTLQVKRGVHELNGKQTEEDNQVSFTVVSRKESVFIRANSAVEREEWVQAISALLNNT